MDLVAAEDGASERVRELLRDQQLAPARRLLHKQLCLAPRDGARWAQLANLERRCAKRRRKGEICAPDCAGLHPGIVRPRARSLDSLTCAVTWERARTCRWCSLQYVLLGFSRAS